MNILRNLQIEGSNGRMMLADLYAIQNGERKPIILFAHGFKGFKDWGCWDLVAKRFANAGFVFVKFNFSHNGTSVEQPTEFADLEAFGHNSFLKEQFDLGKMIDWIANGNTGIPVNELSRREIFLVGHSRGGAAVLLTAAADNRVKKLATWASISRIGRFWTEERLAKWKADGVQYILNGRTGQQMPMYWSAYQEYYDNMEKLDVMKAATDLTIPMQVVHAIDDTVVSVEASKELTANGTKHELLQLDNGGHTFGAKHPWKEEELPSNMEKVVQESIDFFGK